MLARIWENLQQNRAPHVVAVQLFLAAALCLTAAVAAAGARPDRVQLASRPTEPVILRAAVAVSDPPREAAPSAEAGLIRLQDLSPDMARAWNASNPISRAPNPPARPFRLNADGVLDEVRAADCMTAAIYYEAGRESLDGQRAVAQVVLNRLRNPLFPKSVCGVVFQGSERASGCQFTFTCDGSLGRRPDPEAWERARKVAAAALHGHVMKKVGNATHYHANYVAPYWSPSLVKVAVVGQHVFYRWTGGLGLPPAFGGRYAGGEMAGLQIAALDDLSRGSPALAAAVQAGEPAPALQRAAVVEAAPPADPVAEAGELIAASATAQDAAAALGPEELDWQGRPRRSGPPRIARPSAGLGGF